MTFVAPDMLLRVALCVLFGVFCSCDALTGVGCWKRQPLSLAVEKRPSSPLASTVALLTTTFTLLGPVTDVNAAMSPLGNLDAAIEAVVANPDSLFCSLDNLNSNGISCQQLDYVVRWRAGRLLTIRQDWGGSASTGAAIWNGANVATWYLEHELGPQSVQGKSVLELGAGVGFTSLVASSLGAAEVVITDGNEDVLKLAEQNIALNLAAPEKESGVRTARLRWNTEDEKSLLRASSGQPWDFVFASDVTYRKAGWADLVACISHLTGPNTQSILSMEPRNIGEVEGVLGLAREQGLTIREVPVLSADPEKTLCTPFCARLFVLTRAGEAAPATAPSS